MIARTKTLLAAVAAVAMVGSTALPTAAIAKDKKKGDAEAPKITKEVRDGVLAADKAIDAKDYATADTQIAAAEAAAKSDYDHYWIERVKLKKADAVKDNAAVVASLDKLLANPQTPKKDYGVYYFSRGAAAVNMKQPKQALEFFQKARENGLNDPAVPLRIAGLKFDAGDVDGGITELENAMKLQKAAGKAIPDDWYRFGIQNLQKADSPKQWDWFRMWISAYPKAENWRIMLGNYYGVGIQKLPEAQQNPAKIGLYRLMAETGALPDLNSYLLYADLANKLGYRHEVVALIDKGRAAGVIKPSDAQATKFYNDAKSAIRSDGSIASIESDARKAKDGRLARLAATSYMATGNPTKAVELYQLALTKGGVDKDTTTMDLGIAQYHAKDYAAARQTMTSLEGSSIGDIAKFWLIKIDQSASPATTAPAPAAASADGAASN